MIKTGNKNEPMPDFNDMMNDVEHKIEGKNAEQEIIDRVPELKQMLSHYREINEMLIEDHKRARKQFEEYDGIWFGHYGQWFFMFFFIIGIIVVLCIIIMLVGKSAGWIT